MPKSQRMTLAELEARCFTEGGHVEHDPDTGLSFWMFNKRERAYAITDVSRPGVSSR